MTGEPLAYLITFHTCGTWLHGDERGSVDRNHNRYATPQLIANTPRRRAESGRLAAPPLNLTAAMRSCVQTKIAEVCERKAWTLHELNVRTNHVHLVVSSAEPPERVLNVLKSWCTRRLRETGLLPDDRPTWSRHGSTRYIWKPHELRTACRYVLDAQGSDITPR